MASMLDKRDKTQEGTSQEHSAHEHYEHTTHDHVAINEDEIERENGEVLLVIDTSIEKDPALSGIKLAKDGRTILIPQPTEDIKDPLNWSPFKKHIILICVAFGAFAGDFGACAGIPTIVVQGIEWQMSPLVVNYANNLAAIMCGISGLLWMPLLNAWGRIPVLFWSSFLGMCFTLGSVLSPNFPTYYGMRTLQAVTQSTGQTIGLAFIKDMFFFHEHARKIGIWYTIFICSPFFSPLLGNFMVATLGDWRPIFWVNFAWAGMLICLILVFGDETYYNRQVPMSAQPARNSNLAGRLARVTGLWQIRNHKKYFPSILTSYGRLFEVFLKPVIPMSMLYYSAVFMWCIGINVTSSILLETPVAAGGYGLGPLTIGYVYFTPIVAVFLGEFFGHYFNDYIALRYTRRHHGLFVPEVRLWTTYIGAAFMIPGLILVGESLKKHLSIVAIIFGWGMFQFGVMIVSVATVAYVLDCYPSASGEVSALLNFGRVGIGFTVGYFQQQWGAAQGYDVSFGLQAVVVVCAFFLLAIIQKYGAKIRLLAGPVSHLKV